MAHFGWLMTPYWPTMGAARGAIYLETLIENNNLPFLIV
jgi:hypothetical protein